MSTEENINVVVHIRGVVLPTWAAVVLSLCLVFSGLTFLAAYFQIKRAEIELTNLKKEIRILQLHTEDVESVLIREGVASRKDFAEWTKNRGK